MTRHPQFDPLEARMAQALGTQLRTLRQANRLTIVDLARAAGMDGATISRIESGRMLGTVVSHVKLAAALGVPLAQLYADLEPIRHQRIPVRPVPKPEPAPVPVLAKRIIRLARDILTQRHDQRAAKGGQGSRQKSPQEGTDDFAVPCSREVHTLRTIVSSSPALASLAPSTDPLVPVPELLCSAGCLEPPGTSESTSCL